MLTAKADKAERGARDRRRRVVEHIVARWPTRVPLTIHGQISSGHILSQPRAWPHTKVHAVMLRQVLRERDRREMFGQVVRMVVAGPGSLAGKYPVGNTGRTTMALTEIASVPPDLDAISRQLTLDPEQRIVQPPLRAWPSM